MTGNTSISFVAQERQTAFLDLQRMGDVCIQAGNLATKQSAAYKNL